MVRIHDGAAAPDPESGPAAGLSFAVVVSRFNDFVTSKLLDGCLDHLAASGADDDAIDVFGCLGRSRFRWSRGAARRRGGSTR